MRSVLLCFIGLIVASQGIAAKPSIGIKPLAITHTQDNNFKAWGLTTIQWQHYQTLMSGPSGLWYAHLNPAEVLGINAKNNDERNQYARIVVRARHDRIKKELAFEHATHLAWQQLYPHLKPIAPFDTRSYGPSFAKRYKVTLKPDDHLLLFTSIDNVSNWAVVPLLVGLIELHSHSILDIYFLHHPTDESIRLWAERMQLPRRLVNQSRITLNPSGSDTNKGFKASTLPQVYIQHNEKLKAVHWEALA